MCHNIKIPALEAGQCFFDIEPMDSSRVSGLRVRVRISIKLIASTNCSRVSDQEYMINEKSHSVGVGFPVSYSIT
jgi:hypothetical protein